jgi:hypothetical protein
LKLTDKLDITKTTEKYRIPKTALQKEVKVRITLNRSRREYVMQ